MADTATYCKAASTIGQNSLALRLLPAKVVRAAESCGLLLSMYQVDPEALKEFPLLLSLNEMKTNITNRTTKVASVTTNMLKGDTNGYGTYVPGEI